MKFYGLTNFVQYEMPDSVDEYDFADDFAKAIEELNLSIPIRHTFIEINPTIVYGETYPYSYVVWNDGDMSVGIFGESCKINSTEPLSGEDIANLTGLYTDYFDFRTYLVKE